MALDASNVLLCLRYGIGDLVMELPAVDRLRETLPRAKITGLGAEPAIEIPDHDPRLDEVASIQRWGVRHLGDPADETVHRQFADWLVSGQFDRILDPSHAAHAVRQIIYQQDSPIRDSDSACLEAGLAQGLDGLAAIKWGIRQGWGLEVPASCHPEVRPGAEEFEWARRFLADRDLTRDLLALSPGASHDLKRWPTDHFACLCRVAARD